MLLTFKPNREETESFHAIDYLSSFPIFLDVVKLLVTKINRRGWQSRREASSPEIGQIVRKKNTQIIKLRINVDLD